MEDDHDWKFVVSEIKNEKIFFVNIFQWLRNEKEKLVKIIPTEVLCETKKNHSIRFGENTTTFLITLNFD